MPKRSFSEELYQDIGINSLIIFCIYRVTERKEKCVFEKLVQECFFSFPEVFSFVGLKWPDSRKLDRPLRALRRRKIISGGPAEVIQLTKIGRKIAEDLSKTFSQRKLQI